MKTVIFLIKQDLTITVDNVAAEDNIDAVTKASRKLSYLGIDIPLDTTNTIVKDV